MKTNKSKSKSKKKKKKKIISKTNETVILKNKEINEDNYDNNNININIINNNENNNLEKLNDDEENNLQQNNNNNNKNKEEKKSEIKNKELIPPIKDENQIILKLLTDKQNTIVKDLKILKENKYIITNISLKNIGTSKSLIDNNVNNDELKKIKNKENELTDKLYSIKSQINLLPSSITNKNNTVFKSNLKNYLSYYKNELNRKNFICKLRKLNMEQKNYLYKNEEYLKKLEKENNDKIEEEKNLKEKKKEEYLNEQRLKEKYIILKRKQKIDEKIKNIMNNKNNKINVKKDYLYLQMENEFIENEKNLLKDIKKQKKLNLVSPEETEIINKRMVEVKNKLEERAIKQTKELHKLWHSRSSILQKLKSPIFKEINEIKDNQIKKNKNENIINLVKNKNEYIKNNIKLPPISELLKKELKNKIKKNLSNSIISRNNKIGKNLKFYSYNNSKSNEENINNNNKKIIPKKLSLPGNIFKSISNKSNGSNSVKNLKSLSNNISKKIIKSPHDINYLEEIRLKRIKDIDTKYDLSKDILILENKNDISNLKIKIGALESKYKRSKELLKLQGGYLKNQELGDNINELLIDSIKGKLAIIESK